MAKLNGPGTSFKAAIISGSYQMGSFVQLPSPEIVELYGLAGFDFVVLDLEHGAYGFDHLRDMIRAAELHSVAPIVRVAEIDPSLVSRVLDLGAAGVMVPQISSVADLRAVLDAARYSPRGTRGYCSGVRAAGYAGAPGFTDAANKAALVIPLIENLKAVDQYDAILALDGLDAVMIGPGDLSAAMGHPGAWHSPPVSSLLDDLVSRASLSGVPVGMHVKEPVHAAAWHKKGVRFFTYGMDAQVIVQHLSRLRSDVASHIQGSCEERGQA